MITDTKSQDDWLSNNVIDGGADPLITLTYKDIAKDINGNTHDVVVKINKITFTNLNSIIDRPAGRKHDENIYVDDDAERKYYRDVLSYGKGYLRFDNYARNTAGNKIIKRDAGEDIDFSIEVKDALPNTSILFFIDDMDVAAKENPKLHQTDACFDSTPWEDVSYDRYSEGIVLREGNDTDTLLYADHTGLVEDSKTVNGNSYTYIHGTGSDPSSGTDTPYDSTGWSAFSVKADAQKSSYTWTSGVGCTTDFLNPTKGTTIPDVVITPQMEKTVNSQTPSGDYAKGFEFRLKKAEEITNVDIGGETYQNLALGANDNEKASPNAQCTGDAFESQHLQKGVFFQNVHNEGKIASICTFLNFRFLGISI